MKKAFTILLSLAVGSALGLVIVMLGKSSGSTSDDAINPVVDVVALFVAVALAAYLQIILHEAGHLVCGLLSGYRFVSFRVGSLTLLNDGNGKLRFKRFKIAGTGGQCLMSPPDVPIDKLPTGLYNAGGSLMNLLCATVALLLIIYCDNMHFFVKYFLSATVAVGYVFALLNGIPMKLGGMANDGHNMLYLRRDKQSVKGFYSQLVINEKQQNGTRLSQMPEELFNLDGDINFSDPMQANVELMRCSRVLDQGDIEQAYRLFNELNYSHLHELMTLYQFEAQSDLLYACLASGHINQAKSLLNEQLERYITKYASVMTSKQRTLMAKALILDGDRAEAERLYNDVVARRDSYLMQGEVKSDIELMKHLLEAQNNDQNQVKSTN